MMNDQANEEEEGIFGKYRVNAEQYYSNSNTIDQQQGESRYSCASHEIDLVNPGPLSEFDLRDHALVEYDKMIRGIFAEVVMEEEKSDQIEGRIGLAKAVSVERIEVKKEKEQEQVVVEEKRKAGDVDDKQEKKEIVVNSDNEVVDSAEPVKKFSNIYAENKLEGKVFTACASCKHHGHVFLHFMTSKANPEKAVATYICANSKCKEVNKTVVFIHSLEMKEHSSSHSSIFSTSILLSPKVFGNNVVKMNFKCLCQNCKRLFTHHQLPFINDADIGKGIARYKCRKCKSVNIVEVDSQNLSEIIPEQESPVSCECSIL